MIWVWLVLLAAPARADPVDALAPVARRFFLEGRQLEQRGDFREAAQRYRTVIELDPAWLEAVVALGRAYEKAGDLRAARRAYEQAPFDPPSVEALGRLLLAQGDHEGAEASFVRLRALRPEWPGAIHLQAQAMAGIDAVEAAELLRAYLSFPLVDLDDAGVVDTAARISTLLREGDHDAEARALLEELVQRFPDAAGAEDIDRLLVDFEIEEEALRLAEAVHVPLHGAQIDQLVAARSLAAAGDLAAAEGSLDALLGEAPHNAVVWATLADVRESRGDFEGAEQAIRAAARLDPLEASYPARQGDLLSRWFGGRFDGEAAAAYDRAVRRRSADADLWFRKAQAERRAGMWVRAQASYGKVLELEPVGPLADAAREQVEGARRDRAPTAGIPPAPGRPEDVPEAAWLAFHRAWAWRQRAEDGSTDALDKALSELGTTRALAPDFVRALNLEAAIRVERGERPEAISLYEESLAADPAQDPVMVVLAELYSQAGRTEPADRLLERAAALDNPDALWVQARRQAQAGSWWAARRTLERYFARSMSSSASYADAQALDASMAARIQAVQLGAATTGGLVVGLPLLVRWRRRSGVPITGLLARAPGAYRDVARILSAIRHEVLKHNTTVLELVADALDDGDAEPARWAAERLFAPHGAVPRFRGYIGELVEIGRAHGVRLNLRWRDPTLGPLIAAMDGLTGLERDLSLGRGRRLAETLRALAEPLNRTGYRALGRLLTRVCVLRIDAALLTETYEAVLAEPGFRDAARLPLQLEVPEQPIRVRLFRSDLQDILSNLLRNSLQASHGAGAARLGLRVALEEDPITGLERVQLRVLDDSPRALSTAMIRGRYIGRGLGLAVDQISRAGGSIHVESEPGWSKAVVVRLPRAEVSGEPEDDGEA